MDQDQAPFDTSETAPSELPAPEADLDAASEAAPEAVEGGESAPEGEEAAARPREIIRGISPDLRCECPECAPEYTELQFFSPEEEKKTKGTIMLYCQRSARKYFSPAVDFNAWYAAQPKRKARRDA